MADGVALAAIQGLNSVVEEQAAEIGALEERIESWSRCTWIGAGGISGVLFALIGALSTLVIGLGALLLRNGRVPGMR